METLQIEKKNAISAYNKADEKGKKLLADLLGEKNISQNIMERVTGFQDILDISGEPAKKYELRTDETEDELAYRMLKLIAKVLNEGVVLDSMDTSQPKYFPWPKIDKTSGFGLSFDDYVIWNSHSIVGVHLCLKNSDLAEFSFKTFTAIHSKFLINKSENEKSA